MLNQTKIDQFIRWRAGNIERDMDGVTTGILAVVRWIFLVVMSWSSLAVSLAIFIAILKSAGASLDVAMISFFAFLLMWLLFSFTSVYSRLIDYLVTLLEAGLFPQVGCFREPASSMIFPRFTQYISPVLGLPTAPPLSRA